MKLSKIFNVSKNIISVCLICLLGLFVIIFSALYFGTFSSGVLFDNFALISNVVSAVLSFTTIITLLLSLAENKFFYKIFYLTIIFLSISFIILYLFKKSGLYLKISSVEEFRAYITEFGSIMPIAYITFSFLQMIILPIPGIITISAGVLLFGPFWSAVYSFIGIVLGSICAYLIGKVLGQKFISWLVGEKTLFKWQNHLKGKDKILFTFMFLFPFFPDDILCFIAGISTMSPQFFIIMTVCVRLITSFVSTYSLNNSLIPYNTWWGIIVWVVIILSIFFIAIYVYKNSEKINYKITKTIVNIKRK